MIFEQDATDDDRLKFQTALKYLDELADPFDPEMICLLSCVAGVLQIADVIEQMTAIEFLHPPLPDMAGGWRQVGMILTWPTCSTLP